MSDHNPYAALTAPPAAFAAASERAAFLKKVYGLLFLGMLGFAATLWAAGNVAPVREMMLSLWGLIRGTRYGFLVYIGVFMAGSFAVQALAEKRPINAIAYAGWAFLLGLLVAPLVLAAGPELVSQASLITALVFGGLTLFVLWTGKDFSFLRGTLFVVGMGLFVAMLAGWLFGFGMGMWLSVGIVALMAGYILYQTSEILHRFPTTMAMSAAIILFTDVVLLFKHILILLMRSRD
ncbi:MAG: US12 family protein [Planctomycetes bacterium]|nr:US12 family protein [Planctomycetota bacterium]